MFSGRVLKQIIVITDGHSNKGVNPVHAARYVHKKGISVSAIGILDAGKLGFKGSREVKEIASAGGGVCCLIPMEQLSRTVHTVTVEAVRQNIIRLVNQSLQRTGTELTGISPKARSALMSLISDMEDKTELHLVLVIDTSGSMAGKKELLAESLVNVMLSMAGRQGKVALGIVQFPGPGGIPAVVKPLFSDNRSAARILRQMVFGGKTPTGPAILTAALELMPDLVHAAGRGRCYELCT